MPTAHRSSPTPSPKVKKYIHMVVGFFEDDNMIILRTFTWLLFPVFKTDEE